MISIDDLVPGIRGRKGKTWDEIYVIAGIGKAETKVFAYFRVHEFEKNWQAGNGKTGCLCQFCGKL